MLIKGSRHYFVLVTSSDDFVIVLCENKSFSICMAVLQLKMVVLYAWFYYGWKWLCNGDWWWPEMVVVC